MRASIFDQVPKTNFNMGCSIHPEWLKNSNFTQGICINIRERVETMPNVRHLVFNINIWCDSQPLFNLTAWNYPDLWAFTKVEYKLIGC